MPSIPTSVTVFAVKDAVGEVHSDAATEPYGGLFFECIDSEGKLHTFDDEAYQLEGWCKLRNFQFHQEHVIVWINSPFSEKERLEE